MALPDDLCDILFTEGQPPSLEVVLGIHLPFTEHAMPPRFARAHQSAREPRPPTP